MAVDLKQILDPAQTAVLVMECQEGIVGGAGFGALGHRAFLRLLFLLSPLPNGERVAAKRRESGATEKRTLSRLAFARHPLPQAGEGTPWVYRFTPAIASSTAQTAPVSWSA